MDIFYEAYERINNGIHSFFRGVEKFFTIFLVIVNFIIVLCGIAVFCSTFYAIWIFNTYKDLVVSPKNGEEAVYVVLVACISAIAVSGVIIVFLGLLGATAAYTKNRRLLLTNCILTTLLFVVELTVLLVVESTKEKLHENVKLSITQVYYQENPNSTLPGPNLKQVPATNAWALLQKTFKCCGYNDGDDWKKYNKYTEDQMQHGYVCEKGTLEHGCKDALESPLYTIKTTVIIVLVVQGIAVFGCIYLLLEETLEEWAIENTYRERERNRRNNIHGQIGWNKPWTQLTYSDRNDIAIQQADSIDDD